MAERNPPVTSTHFRDHSTPPRGASAVAASPTERARAAVESRKKDVAQAEKERARLKAFPILAVVTPLVALPFDWRVAVGLCATWLAFWGVGAYLNFFHRRDMAQKLADAERALAELTAGGGGS